MHPLMRQTLKHMVYHQIFIINDNALDFTLESVSTDTVKKLQNGSMTVLNSKLALTYV